MKDEKKEISRRDVLIGAGTIAAGAAVLSSGVASFVSNAKAGGAAPTLTKNWILMKWAGLPMKPISPGSVPRRH